MDQSNLKSYLNITIRIGFTLTFFAAVDIGYAQSESDLQKVRKEIQQLESEIASKASRERSLLEQVEDADREIGLKRKLLNSLDQEKREKQIRIRQTETTLEKTLDSYEKTKALIGRRMAALYMRGHLADWEALFSLSSLNQALVLMQYQKRIIETDRRNMQALSEKEDKIQRQQNILRRELRAKDELLREETEAAKDLEEKKTSRQALLSSVRQDKKQLQEKLRRKQQAYEEIKGRISRAEQQTKTFVSEADGRRFAQLKGKLDWPVKGSVVAKHGRVKDPELKTWIENLGIDIQASDGDAVRSVSMGEVVGVTWMRGMGNVVLLAHGGGYYTVYGHLDVVLVESGDSVEKGAVIGYAGDDQGLNGSMVHFEVWKGANHVDPAEWLRKP